MTIRSQIQTAPVASYIVLAYLISWGGSFAVGGPKFLRGEPLGFEDAMRMVPLVLAGPFIGGLAMTYLVDGKTGLRDLFLRMLRWRVGLRWYAAAVFVFPALILGVLWALTVLVSPDFSPTFTAFGVLAGLLVGVIEETGWMGFAYPRMQRMFGTWRATIYLALLHGLWHAMAGYLGEAGTYGEYWLPRFIAMWFVAMTAMRVLLVWIYANTGSLLLAQLTHASSTGFLIIFGPAAVSPAQETLWWAVYAAVLWIPAILVVARFGRTLVRQPGRTECPPALSRTTLLRGTRSVRADKSEQGRELPGDDLIPQPIGSLTHAITIHRPPRSVWPWLAQMGAGSRAGWYSYDFLDNGRRPSARRIVPELQQVTEGMIFPALPGMTEGFTVLACAPERSLILGWILADGTPMTTWAFVLEARNDDSTRLVVRARAGAGYEFHGLPRWLTRRIVPILHFIMQRKQLIGVAKRAESPLSTVGDTGPASEGKSDTA
jgi:membrane protease YdiL (CAAX protease family)